MFDKEYFSRKMKVKRAESGWTQEDLAKASGISHASIASYESGRTTPSFDAVISLANAFNCLTDDFWTRK